MAGKRKSPKKKKSPRKKEVIDDNPRAHNSDWEKEDWARGKRGCNYGGFDHKIAKNLAPAK